MTRYPKICPKCGYTSRLGETLCANCGTRLSMNDEERWKLEHDMMEYIEVNVPHYSIALQRQKQGRSIGWNWAAFLMGGVWAIYRKMYKFGILLLAIQLVIGLVLNLLVLLSALPELTEYTRLQFENTGGITAQASDGMADMEVDSSIVKLSRDESFEDVDFYTDPDSNTYYQDQTGGNSFDTDSGTESYYFYDGSQGSTYLPDLFQKTPLQLAEEALNRKMAIGNFWLFFGVIVFRVLVGLFGDKWYLSFVRKKVERAYQLYPEPEMALSMEEPRNLGFAILSHVVASIASAVLTWGLSVAVVVLIVMSVR